MTFWKMLVLAAAALLAACSGTDPSETASESQAASDLGSRPVPVYLALGDSVAFGWRDSLADSTVPWVFAGYPQLLALGLRLSLLDAACPSETSGSFLSGAGSGCQVYREDHALHVSYPGSQLAYALEVVASQRLRLVTVQLGVNELELLVGACAGDAACIGERLPALLQETAANVATAVGALRQAGYQGQVVVLDYYNPSADPAQGGLLGVLDQALAGAATATGADFVDLKQPFQEASAWAGGDPCAAGLIARVAGRCEIHPSWLGHLLIARLVGEVVDAR